MSMGGPPGAPIPCPSTALAGPMKVGGALGTPTSFCQPPATRPVAVSTIISTKTPTTPSETTPTLSCRRRRQAARQTPSERAAAGAAVVASGGRTAPMAGPPFEDDPWIDELVEDVDGQVDEHRDHRQVDREGLDHRVVAAVDGEDDLAADAGN